MSDMSSLNSMDKIAAAIKGATAIKAEVTEHHYQTREGEPIGTHIVISFDNGVVIELDDFGDGGWKAYHE